jgi:hypothetical protein
VEPHLRLHIPFQTVNREVARHLRRQRSTVLGLPKLPGVGISLGRVRVKLARVTMRRARPGHVGFRTVLDVLDGKRTVASLELDTEVRPRIDLKKRTVSATLRPKDIKAVRPRLSPGSAKRLAGALHPRLPRAARMLVSKNDLAEVADRILKDLVPRSWPTIRRELLADVGEIASFEVDLPDLPLKSVAVASSKTSVELAIVTDLPVDKGAPPVRGHGSSKNDPVLYASGSALAALANWGMKTGQLPARYDEAGAPQKNGPLHPTLTWQDGKRPLKVHVFDERDPCLYVLIGATPKATRKGKEIEVVVRDGTIEKAVGPTKLKLLGWSQRMGRNTFSLTETLAAQMELELAGRSLRLEVREIKRHASLAAKGADPKRAGSWIAITMSVSSSR